MNHRRSPITRVALLLSGLLAIAALLAPVASAQTTSTPEPLITFRVSSYTCPTDPGNVSVAAGNIPDSCTPDADLTYHLTAADGTALGSCTTDANGLCALEVPNEVTVTVTQDTPPTGTAPRENPITTQAVTEFAGALFINLPTAAETPVTEPTLPNTGSGPATSTPGYGIWTLAALGTVLLAGAGVLTLRQRQE